MSKRASVIALAAGAVLSAGVWVGAARAADPTPNVPPVAPGGPPTPTAPAVAPAGSDQTSVLNEYAFKPLGVDKTLADAKIQVGGWVEGSFTYNFRAPGNQINEGRVFDFEHNAARLNQVALQIARMPDIADVVKSGKMDIGFGVDMQYGSDGRLIHSNGIAGYNSAFSPINQFDLTQAWVDILLPVGKGLDVKIGKFVTPFGNETIAPIKSVTGSSGNQLYSHSYNFGFGIPFTHTGVLATFVMSDNLKLYGGFSRGWEQSTKDNNGSIEGLGGAVYTLNSATTATVNVSVGPQRAANNHDYRYVIEGILGYSDPKKTPFSWAADGLLGWDEHAAAGGGKGMWYGVTGYAGYTLNPTATVNGRLEWFRDDGGSRLGLSAHFFEGTIGVSLTPFANDKLGKNLVIRPELRGDLSDKKAFNSGRDRTQATVAVDAIFSL